MKKKLITGFLLVIVVLFGYLYMKPVTFEKNSVYLVFSNDGTKELTGRSFHEAIIYHGMKKVSIESVSDIQSVRKVDPAYELNVYDEATDGMGLNKVHSLLMLVNVTENNATEYSQITYRESGKVKTVDVGKHHYEMVSTPEIKMLDIDSISEDRVFEMIVEAKDVEITKVEFANPEVPATLTDLKKLDSGEYRYVIHVDQFPEEYESFQTSMKFTVLKDGKEEIRYGDGRLTIGKHRIGFDYTENSKILYQ